MNGTDNQRPKFTLMQLFVAVTVIAMLLAIGTQWIRWQQERGRQLQCESNLRQMALGIHNYYDTQGQLPPLATDPGHFTWVELVPALSDLWFLIPPDS